MPERKAPFKNLGTPNGVKTGGINGPHTIPNVISPGGDTSRLKAQPLQKPTVTRPIEKPGHGLGGGV